MIGKILKWIAIVIGVLIVIVAVAALVLYRTTTTKLTKVYKVNVEAVAVPTDAAAVERGKHIASFICMGCHGKDLGGTELIADPSIGTINALNLTPGKGGAGSEFTDEDWVRAIRHGVDPEGRGLLIMPSQNFYYMSDADLGALIAFLKSLPPVDKEWPDPQLQPMAKIMAGAGMFGDYLPAESIPHDAPRPADPQPGVTPEYGAYLVHLGDCQSCHGKDMHGGKSGEPGAPEAPNVSANGEIASWSQTDFVNTIKTGTTPNGKVLDESMPWKEYANMSDDELAAIYAYLKSLP